MPRKNRYKLLCEAYDRGIGECDQYRKECHEFVQDIKASILESLGCLETKLYMYAPSVGFVYNSHMVHGDALDTEFYEDGIAGIGFAVNLNGSGIEEKFFAFVLTFTKMGSKIKFKVDDEKEFVNTAEGIEEFCNYMFTTAERNLSNRLSSFLQSPQETTSIGFKIADRSKTAKPEKAAQ